MKSTDHPAPRRFGAIAAVFFIFLVLPLPAKAEPTWRLGQVVTSENSGGDPDLDPLFRKTWKWFRPGLEIRHVEYESAMIRPLTTGSNNFFHHLLLLPALECANILPAESFHFSASLGHSFNTDAGEKPGNRFRASFTEARFDLGFGLGSAFELRSGFNLARFAFSDSNDLGATQEGVSVFPPDDFSPGLGLGDVNLGLKIALPYRHKYDIGLATVLTVKIPAGKSDFLTSGRGDFAMAFVATYKLKITGGFRFFFHFNFGWAFFDEESVFPRKVYVNSAAFYGFSIVAPFGPKKGEEDGFRWAAILQCQGNENAFQKLDQFNSYPTTVHGALRAIIAGWIVEAGVGFGVTKQGSSDYVIDIGVSRSF